MAQALARLCHWPAVDPKQAFTLARQVGSNADGADIRLLRATRRYDPKLPNDEACSLVVSCSVQGQPTLLEAEQCHETKRGEHQGCSKQHAGPRATRPLQHGPGKDRRDCRADKIADLEDP